MKTHLWGAVCVGVIACVINTSSNAADYTFMKIFDTNDPIPNGAGNFTGFSLPSLDGRNIAFGGRGEFGYAGIYTLIGGNLNLVADSSTAMPGGSSNFDWLVEPIIDGNNVAFAGGYGVEGNFGSINNGIYTDLGGSVRVVADLNTPVPGGQVPLVFYRTKTSV